MKALLSLCLGATLLLGLTYAKSHSPEQLHLSLGSDETEMLVTWTTIGAVKDKAKVEFGTHKSELKHSAKAEEQHFKEGNTEFHTFRALMTGLTPGSTYHYRVGSHDTEWSKVFHFRTLPAGSNWNPRLSIFGDLGYSNAVSTPFLTQEVANDKFDVIFHVGDFAYDLHSKDGERGHKFMNMIEPIAARVPYMTCAGNHEMHDNFSHYEARFSMLGDRTKPNLQVPLERRLNNQYHSMQIGPATIIVISTEYYFYTKFGWEQIKRQYEWLEEQLKLANANRAERPWIIVMGHRSPYCIKKKGDVEEGDVESECDILEMERPFLRKGIHMRGESSSPIEYGLEELFYKYGVDIGFYGHEHHYGRLLPIYNQEAKSGPNPANPYDKPNGPVHIITGAAGSKHEHGKFNKHPKNWLAHTAKDYGYTRLEFKDRLHIVIEQTSDEQGGVVIDQIEILKSQAQPHWLVAP